MTEGRLDVVFEGPDVGHGVPLDDVQKTWGHVQTALRLMVHHLRGGDEPIRGRPRDDVRELSTLLFTGAYPGSLGTSLELPPTADGLLFDDDIGVRALDSILGLGRELQNDTVPDWVAGELRAISSDLSAAVSQVRIGDPSNGRQLILEREARTRPRPEGAETALLHGWLREVNWERRTAQLHDDVGAFVALRFERELDDDMLRCATQHVRVEGEGRFNDRDEWTTVRVAELEPTRSWRRAFDGEEFWTNPDPKIFDPNASVTASESFDVDEFVSVIHEARDTEDLEARNR